MGGAWVSLTMWGLAPLIVTTYCLWYLKKADENVMGLFIVTPVVILIHYFVMGIAAHTGFWGVILSLIELAAAIAFVVIARRKGYVRHQPSTQSMTTKNHLQDTLAL
jgi:mannose/fructose/N-acetylgalactosamine-specific phosphotransferase system component IID